MDHALQREVALKEYMPAALAARGAGRRSRCAPARTAETYAIGLRSFVNEARLLARFDHPSLVKVYRFWEDNGTAYMVMPYLQGRTLRDHGASMPQRARRDLAARPARPAARRARGAAREGVYHRDIAPDNILLPPGGPPVLLDFGAARRVISDRTQTLTAILKPSYAPIEQYAEMTQLRQGPWTDLYAVGAVLHFALLGTPPPPATARALEDELVPLAQRHFPGVSQRFLLPSTGRWRCARRIDRKASKRCAPRSTGAARCPPVCCNAPRWFARRLRPTGPPTTPRLHLGHPGTLPTQADTAHQATMPMQPSATVPMQPTVPLSAMAATQPMLPTRPMVPTQATAAPMQAMPPGEAMVTPLTASAAVGAGQLAAAGSKGGCNAA